MEWERPLPTQPPQADFTATIPRRLMTFALSKSNEGTNIETIGYFQFTPSPYLNPHVRGTIFLQNRKVPVVDMNILSGLPPKTITNQSCIVFLDAGNSYQQCGTAVIAEDISEVLAIANQKGRDNTLSDRNTEQYAVQY